MRHIRLIVTIMMFRSRIDGRSYSDQKGIKTVFMRRIVSNIHIGERQQLHSNLVDPSGSCWVLLFLLLGSFRDPFRDLGFLPEKKALGTKME